MAEIVKYSLEEKKQITSKAGYVSIFVNTILFVIKYWAGLSSGSVAIIADAWHTLSDSITSIILVFSGFFSNKPADEEHPYGHGRFELIASIVIAVILALVAVSFIQDSISKILSKETADYGIFAISATVLSVVAKEWLARYALKLSKKIDSQSIKADAWHHRSDALSSVVVLAGIFLNSYLWWIDAVLGFIISIFLLHASYVILKSSINPLLGKEADSKLINQITDLCREVAGKKTTPHHFHYHDYGNHAEISFHIRFEKNVTLEYAHNIASKIELEIRDKLNIEATIHMEPYK